MKRLGYAALATVAVGGMLFGYYLFASRRPLSLVQPVLVTVSAGSGTEGAVEALYQAGAIRSRWVMYAHLFLTGQRTAIRAGQYTFTGDTSIVTVTNTITRRINLPNELQVTLVEGWTSETMAEQLASVGLVRAGDFLAAAQPQSYPYTFLHDWPNPTTLEGFLFPDTYRFYQSDTAHDVVDKLLANFDAKLTPALRQQIIDQGHTLYQVITLASIVEKEASRSDDRAIIADIFWKRLAAGKRLESDVTILYALRHSDQPFDVNIESTYNTYRNAGLPPSPICNPSLDAITAVINPTATDYWYFLAAPSGEVIYSTTYDEHLAAKQQYL